MSENIKVNVNVSIGVFENGNLIKHTKEHNLAVTLGKTLICDLLAKTSGVTGLNYFAIGTDDTAEALNNSSLGSEVYRDTFTKITVSSNNLNIKYYLDSSTANGNTLKEAGLFGDNATGVADSGVLFARVTHSDIVKTSSIAVTYSWDITFST
jgi:hypothetical protein